MVCNSPYNMGSTKNPPTQNLIMPSICYTMYSLPNEFRIMMMQVRAGSHRTLHSIFGQYRSSITCSNNNNFMHKDLNFEIHQNFLLGFRLASFMADFFLAITLAS
jgi:hypothetical protein